MARKPGAAERAAELLDLPVDSLAGVPRLTLVGSRSAVVEQHRGLLLYGPEQIEIEGGRVRLRIRGDGLRLLHGNPVSTCRILLHPHHLLHILRMQKRLRKRLRELQLLYF